MAEYRDDDGLWDATLDEAGNFLGGSLVEPSPAYLAALAADRPAAAPDVHAFEEATLKAIGPLRGNTIYAKYPLFLRALDKNDWGDARALLGVALQAQDITQAEHDTIASAMTAAAIP